MNQDLSLLILEAVAIYLPVPGRMPCGTDPETRIEETLPLWQKTTGENEGKGRRESFGYFDAFCKNSICVCSDVWKKRWVKFPGWKIYLS